MLASLHGGVDQILRVKAPIQIEDILTPKPGETLQCVLVEGAPGVGKTTLAWELCKQWGKGKLFQQFATGDSTPTERPDSAECQQYH